MWEKHILKGPAGALAVFFLLEPRSESDSFRPTRNPGVYTSRGRRIVCKESLKCTTYYELRTTYYKLRTTKYVLRTTYYVLRTTYYVPRTTYYVTCFTYHVLRTKHYVPCTTYYILRTSKYIRHIFTLYAFFRRVSCKRKRVKQILKGPAGALAFFF